MPTSRLIVPAAVEGEILVCPEGLSFWGGVDPASGRVVDAHHSLCGRSLAGRIVLMPTSRGSCSGSGMLLELALNGHAPAALVFRENEDILTLGAVVASRMFDRPVCIIRLAPADYDALSTRDRATISGTILEADGLSLTLRPVSADDLALTPSDRAMLDGQMGAAVALAMETICTMAAVQDAERLIDVSRAHIDGCIYSGPAYLTFAETMAEMGARVRIPTTTNALSVDRDNWRDQGVPPPFGRPAARLADTYVRMGARPNFTCAPYLDGDPPGFGDTIGWSESNAVIFANTVLGARTAKHADFLDLFIALTGRAPMSGVYLPQGRIARILIDVDPPEMVDDAFWPLLGYLAGKAAPDRIPRLAGLEGTSPTADDLRAVCAAFGTTSAAPMLHIAGVTPEGDLAAADDATTARVTRADFADAWNRFNTGPGKIDLVALGSPHFSIDETRRFASLMAGKVRHPDTAVMITLGRGVHERAREEGLLSRLEQAGVRVVRDVCWCSITEPVFPPEAKTLMTNSGKYAHYAPGLCGRGVRFGGLADCAEAAVTGAAPPDPPTWLR